MATSCDSSPSHGEQKMPKMCEPCNSSGMTTLATKYCDDCDEYLCDICSSNHGKIKATKSHFPKPLIVLQSRILCEPCSSSGETTLAKKYCNICEELLCHNCTDIHKNMKATKTHTLTAIHTPVQINTSDETPDATSQTFNTNEQHNVSQVEQESVMAKETIEQDVTHSSVFEASSDEDKSKTSNETITTVPKGSNSKRNGVNNVASPGNINEVMSAEEQMPLSSNEMQQTSTGHLKCENIENVAGNTCDLMHETENEQQPVNGKTTITTDKVEVITEEASVTDVDILGKNVHVLNNGEDKKQQCANQISFEPKENQVTVINDLLQPALCSACKNTGNNTIASNHCAYCDDQFCRQCYRVHTLNASTATCAARNEESPGDTCDLCLNIDGQSKTAEGWCRECEEFLCKECLGRHSGSKSLKDHITLSAEEGRVEQNKSAKACSPQNKDSTYEMCDICFNLDGRSEKATGWCRDCEEFLCKGCRARHGVSKHLKDHIILSVEEGRAKLTEQLLLCEPCWLQNKQNVTVAVCIDCENELLCESCAKYHKVQKLTRSHVISTDLTGVKKSIGGKGSIEKPTSPSDANGAQDEQPGKPCALDVGPDTATLTWDTPKKFGPKDFFQVEWKKSYAQSGWQIYNTEAIKRSTFVMGDLKPTTKFIVRVRAIYRFGEGPYSMESEEIVTTGSLGSHLVPFSRRIRKRSFTPFKYELPVTEMATSRNVTARTRKLEIGIPSQLKLGEKTILLIGATGTGKSTLVDGLVNYVLGVDWEDPFRFVTVRLEEEEKQKRNNQAVSQTEWITTYSINPAPGTRLRYRLNIIDTPGFGDCRGLERDQEIVEQIRGLFSEEGPKGISVLDAVCFLIKAPDARLTPIQSYIFQSIMSLFGKDVEQNICSLITFADGDEPPVVAALKESNLPFGQNFTFNNSALFAKNVNGSSLSKMFWEMGLQSFADFFKHLEQFEAQSMSLTKNVLDERFRLQMTVQNVQPKVDAGLIKVDQLKDEIDIIEKHKTLIRDNAHFEYETTEIKQKRHDLPRGQHVTNCINCNFTCHYPCLLADNNDKRHCKAMDKVNGYCTCCPDKCIWSDHANTPYMFEYIPVPVKKTYADMQAKYQEASGQLLTQEQLVQKMADELDTIAETIEDMMLIVKDCNERLADMALRPNPLSLTEHIDLMIENEKMEKRPGFMKRIQSLIELKRSAKKRIQHATQLERIEQENLRIYVKSFVFSEI